MQIPFKKNNIFIILGGVFLIFLGYLLMTTENFIDAEKFSLSLYVCPVLIIFGHIVIAIGIVYRGKKDQTEEAALSGGENISKAG